MFVRFLNYCKKSGERISNDIIIVTKFRERKSKEFWKEVNSRKNNVRNKITEVDGKKTNDDIVEVFYKFSSITGVRNEELGADGDTIFVRNRNFVKRLSTRTCKDAITNLSTGIGFDGVHSNHLKLSSYLIIFVNSKFFKLLINS